MQSKDLISCIMTYSSNNCLETLEYDCRNIMDVDQSAFEHICELEDDHEHFTFTHMIYKLFFEQTFDTIKQMKRLMYDSILFKSIFYFSRIERNIQDINIKAHLLADSCTLVGASRLAGLFLFIVRLLSNKSIFEKEEIRIILKICDRAFESLEALQSHFDESIRNLKFRRTFPEIKI